MRRLVVCAAAIVPFAPAAVWFARNGIPDVLFTGDGAALELGTRHAAHMAQLVGPYSRFGWNHPGPAYFYLALPFYALFDHRGPALNLFAFCANLACAIFIVQSARRLRGDAFALVVAALLGTYELVAVPALLANEWNPIFPILPLLLSYFLALRLATGETPVLPAFAGVASVVVQTHIGFAPAVLVLCGFVWLRWRRTWPGARNPMADVTGRVRWLTVTILALCWILPIFQTVSQPPGNLLRLIWFFLTRGGSQHTWAGPIAIVVEQLATAPWAILETFLHRAVPPPSLLIAGISVAIEAVVLVRLFMRARSRGDDVLKLLVTTASIECVVAVVAVYSIRGFIYPHLVVWVTALGLLPLFTIAAGILDVLNARVGERTTFASAGVLLAIVVALAVSAPVERPPLVRAADVGAESLARSVEAFLRSRQMGAPVVRIVASEQWPTAVAIVLFLDKQGVRVYVEDGWINVVGQPFAAPSAARPALLVGGPEFATEARARDDLAFVGAAEGVSVFLER